MELKQFVNPKILNIFCDASIKNRPNNTYAGCYGAVAVCEEIIIEEEYRFCSDTTNNNSEIKAIRLAIELALKYRSSYEIINIFSDSQISVFGIRERIFKWNKFGDHLYGTTGPIKNQSIFIEIANLIICNSLYVNIWHQMGHVNIHIINQVKEASHVFQSSNNIREKVDYNLIRYISGYNNHVDQRSRTLLRKSDMITYDIKFCDPIYFIPSNNFIGFIRENYSEFVKSNTYFK